MRSKILLLSFTLASSVIGQRSSRLFYVTDQQKGGYNWSVIRTVSKGMAEQMVMNGFTAKGEVIDAVIQKKKADYGPTTSNTEDLPMFTGVAALAYDRQHDRLYYATMFSQQLRYINLSEKEGGRYYQAGNLSSLGRTLENQNAVVQEQQGPVITRMTIGPDGYGYGLSNDGKTFFRFTLNKKTTIESLGSLVDDKKNGNLSVHNACSSWGGDMVAAENGDLYLFTMRQNVFKINPVTKVASFIGKISGLGDNFTVNGAAVDVEGHVVLSTATFPGTRGTIEDFSTLSATEEKNPDYFNASDLASCNYLFEKTSVTKVEPLNEDRSAGISIYPNPATNGFTVLKFDEKIMGRLTIDILGSSGNIQARKPVQINTEGQLVRMSTSRLAKGLYVIRVTDATKKEVFNSKLVVQ